jgi:hypothetical protein
MSIAKTRNDAGEMGRGLRARNANRASPVAKMGNRAVKSRPVNRESLAAELRNRASKSPAADGGHRAGRCVLKSAKFGKTAATARFDKCGPLGDLPRSRSISLCDIPRAA